VAPGGIGEKPYMPTWAAFTAQRKTRRCALGQPSALFYFFVLSLSFFFSVVYFLFIFSTSEYFTNLFLILLYEEEEEVGV
jgi:hypothetical protein